MLRLSVLILKMTFINKQPITIPYTIKCNDYSIII